MRPKYIQAAVQEQRSLGDAPFQQWVAPNGRVLADFHRYAGAYLVRFPGLADYLVGSDGLTVEVRPAPAASAAALEHLYLNQVLPLALSRQGLFVLHGSAVEVEGRAVGFVGASGRGKSTLATSFGREGAPILTDDGLQLEWSADGTLMVLPSHPSVRLWPDSGAALLDGVDVRIALSLEHTAKLRFVGEGLPFATGSRPLARLYFLGAGESSQPQVTPMTSVDIAVELIRSSFLLDIEEREALAAHFDALARIAGRPVHFRLDYPRRYDALESVRGLVRQHLAGAG